MSLPRPINWLRDGAGEDAQKVLDAAEGVKAALEEAQAKLSALEEENNEEASRLQAALTENLNAVLNNMGGVPRNQFIVCTSFPFIPLDDDSIPDEVKTLRATAVPFPVPELAALFAQNVMEVVSTMAARQLIPMVSVEMVEDTASDVLFHTILKDDDEEIVGELIGRFWQYNPTANRPDEVEGTGDWI